MANILIDKNKQSRVYNILKFYPVACIKPYRFSLSLFDLFAIRNGAALSQEFYSSGSRKLTKTNLDNFFIHKQGLEDFITLDDNFDNSFDVAGNFITNRLNKDIVLMKVYDMSDTEVRSALNKIYKEFHTYTINNKDRNVLNRFNVDDSIIRLLNSKEKVLVNYRYLKPSTYKDEDKISTTLRNFILEFFEHDSAIVYNFEKEDPFKLDLDKKALAKFARAVPNYEKIKGNTISTINEIVRSDSFSNLFYSDMKMLV